MQLNRTMVKNLFHDGFASLAGEIHVPHDMLCWCWFPCLKLASVVVWCMSYVMSARDMDIDEDVVDDDDKDHDGDDDDVIDDDDKEHDDDDGGDGDDDDVPAVSSDNEDQFDEFSSESWPVVWFRRYHTDCKLMVCVSSNMNLLTI